jgi:hypothetical protein
MRNPPGRLRGPAIADNPSPTVEIGLSLRRSRGDSGRAWRASPPLLGSGPPHSRFARLMDLTAVRGAPFDRHEHVFDERRQSPRLKGLKGPI